MKKLFASKSGEGYINTAMKIIIAIVVGAIVFGAFYLLLAQIIFPNTQAKINSMISGNPNYVESRIDTSNGLFKFQYSYDGEVWVDSKEVPIFSSSAKLMDYASLNAMNTVALIADNNQLFIVSTNDGGLTWARRIRWTGSFSDGSTASVSASGRYAISIRVGSSRWVTDSKDGVEWTPWSWVHQF